MIFLSRKHLRSWLRDRGYVLVATDRMMKIRALEETVARWSQARFDHQAEIWPLEDKIRELEAEIEGHKRVNATLAGRVAEAELKAIEPDPWIIEPRDPSELRPGDIWAEHIEQKTENGTTVFVKETGQVWVLIADEEGGQP